MTFLSKFRQFTRQTDGGLSIESIITLPMLAWALLACFSYFDGLRQANVNIKAAHAIGDLLSRERDAIDDEYMDGVHDVLKFLVRARGEPRMRVTVVSYNSEDEAFQLEWSETRGGGDRITDATLNIIEPRLPDAFGGAQLIVVETATDYTAPFVLGLSNTTLRNTTVTRLRYVPELNWDDGTEDDTLS